MADGDFDPEAFISGSDTATEPPPEQPKTLPTITPSLSTFYYPSTPEDTKAQGLSYSMEGGIQGGGRFGDIDLRNHTLEQFLSGKSPFVAVAMKGEPTGQEFQTSILGHDVVAKNVDTGGGLRDGQIDFATSNPDLARSGIQHGPFDPESFIKRQDIPASSKVPDINAFLEPAPSGEPAAVEPATEGGGIGDALGKGIGAAAKAIGAPRPQLNLPRVQINQPFTIPMTGQQPPTLIGQTPTPIPQPSPQPMPTPDMSSAFSVMQQMLPQPQSLPEPPQVPYNPKTIPGDFLHNLGVLASDTGQELKGMVNAPVEFSQRAMNPQLSVPSRLAAAAGVVASAAQLDPLLPRGAASREIPGAFSGTELPPAGRQIGVPERPQPQLTEPLQFSVDMPTDTFATEHTPVSSALHEMKVQSKSGAQRAGRYKGNEALWNDVPALAHPTHNKIYSPTGEMPDVAAQNLYDAGLISDPSVQTMWQTVAQESKSARSRLQAQRSDATTITQGAKVKATQTKAFNAAEQRAWKGGQPAIPVKDLQVGDKVTVGGEQFKVTDIDPDTHDVTLEDGTKYGVQSVQDGTVIYGQHEALNAPSVSNVKPVMSPIDNPNFERGSIHINIRGNEIDPNRPLTGWVLPAELGDFPNTMNTRYARAGMTAVYVPREWVQYSKTRPAKIKEGYVPPPENIAVIPPEAMRPSGTVDWTKVFRNEKPPTEAPPPAATPPPRAPASTPPPRQPPAPPSTPPPSQPAAPNPSYSKGLNPVADGGPFRRTYRIDKELGEMMDSLGAAPETGALVAETQSRNMLHELTPQQEADLGKLLLSDRLRGVNPNHPDVIFDSVSRGIESDPAIKKAMDYYRKEIEPELEALGKRAGLKEGAAATQRGKYFTLIPERLPDGTVPELAARLGQTSRTTKYSLPAEGMAAKYSSDIRDVLRQSYTERIRKAAARDLFDAAHAKGVVEKTPQFVPDPENGPTAGKWVQTIKEDSLPEAMKHDLNLIAQGKSSMQPEGIQKVLQGYQRTATAVQLGANPMEIMNHTRRQLHILASKPPIGMGVMQRLSAIVPFFGPKIGALKRAMSDMSTPARQQILKDITSAGGGSSRAFREKYGTQIPVLKNISEFTNKLLFGYPSGKGVMGFDLRMRVLLEEIRRNAEPHLAKDKQRMRQFSNQMGQYGTMASWPVRALRHINPYAATTLPMRWAELRTLVGGSGLKSRSVPEALARRAETFVRGTGGTIAMLTIANKLLSGNWPWQNKEGHEFDLKTGVKDKEGNDIYVPNRFISPELFRAISTYSIPQLLAERGAPNRSALSETAAATLGPINAGLSLINSPALGIAAAAGPQWALHAEKFPGQKSIDIMKVGQYTTKDKVRGIPPLLKRAEGVAEQVHPALAAILGYMDEPIKGLKPLGIITVDKSHGTGSAHISTKPGRGSGGRSSGRGTGGR